MRTVTIDPDSRFMIIAPHPDDESLAAGVLIQRAVAAGAAVRVVYLTDGDDNPWPQRAIERKWRVTIDDRKRWGRKRRREAIAALETLGLRAADARFLGWPDQGLRRLHKEDHRNAASRLASFIAAWKPTDILYPAAADTHRDHAAASLLTQSALRHRGVAREWQYLVHGSRLLFKRSAVPLRATHAERERKRAAIACHATQLRLSRRRFMAYADRSELFVLHATHEVDKPVAVRAAVAVA